MWNKCSVSGKMRKSKSALFSWPLSDAGYERMVPASGLHHHNGNSNVMQMNGTAETINATQEEDKSTRSLETGDEHTAADTDLFLLCCLNISAYSHFTRFTICIVCIFVLFILSGYFLELLFKLNGIKPFGLYLTLVQFLLYSFFSWSESYIHSEIQSRKVPLKIYAFLAFLTVSTMALSNSSVGYLNYPTQVVFKSCNLIPVLIGGILIQGKKYNALEFLAAGLMSAGLVLFVLTDTQVSAKYSLLGILMISGALIADAVIGNIQEKVMKKYVVSSVEMVLYSYSIGAAYILIALLITGQLEPAFAFFAKNPLETYGYGAIFSVTGYFGVQAVLTLIKTSGVFVAVTVTTCRKAVTIVLSYVLFAKPFSFQYIWSGLIIIAGIYLNVYSRSLHMPFSLQWIYTKMCSCCRRQHKEDT